MKSGFGTSTRNHPSNGVAAVGCDGIKKSMPGPAAYTLPYDIHDGCGIA